MGLTWIWLLLYNGIWEKPNHISDLEMQLASSKELDFIMSMKDLYFEGMV